MTRHTAQAAALLLSWTTAIPNGAGAVLTLSTPLLHVLEEAHLPPDDLAGTATIAPQIAAAHAPGPRALAVPALFIDYPPGASVMLHRWPSHGCVLVHVLSGTIHASAWHAGMG